MFRFTIRDVLWLTVVAAVLSAYLAKCYHQTRAALESERQAVEAAKRAEAMARK